MPMKSRKIVKEENIDNKIYYCRKCGKIKKENDFFSCVDDFLDSGNNKLSICKECCNSMYENFIQNEKTMEKTLYRMCKILNIKYDENAVNATKSRLEGKDTNAIFGIYKTQLMIQEKTDNKDPYVTGAPKLIFEEPSKDSIVFEEIESDKKNIEYLRKLWGKMDSDEDYDFLEEEYVRWVSTIGNVSHSEEVLIREICHYQNQIRKARVEGDHSKVGALLKAMMPIMKDSMLTPDRQNAANNGKNADCFGVWLKDIETKRPAEWFEEQTKYKNMNGIEEDIADIKRSTKNFMTNSRDYSTTELEALEDKLDMEE